MGDKAGEQAGDVEREGGDSGFRQGNLTAFIGSCLSRSLAVPNLPC